MEKRRKLANRIYSACCLPSRRLVLEDRNNNNVILKPKLLLNSEVWHFGNWVRLVASDKVKFELDLIDEEIRKLSKNISQTIVNSKIINVELSELNELKSKHIKSHYFNIFPNCRLYEGFQIFKK
jgi:hypothetical protein